MALRAFSVSFLISVAVLSLGKFAVAGDIEEAANESQLTSKISFQTKEGWSVVESPNFRCQCLLNEADSRKVALCCETWRARLQASWMSQPNRECWQPKCEVCVHPQREAYNRILSRPGDTSVGSTTIKFDGGRPVFRRIDVRADANDWSNAALPHELTHVVLADRFGDQPLPRWADEGIAMLSESPEKHRERLASLQKIVAGRSHYRMFDLVKTERLPSAQLRDAFYAQSVALVSLLIQKSTPAKFVDFLATSDSAGIDQALREHYRIDGFVGLQHEWDQWVKTPETITFVSLQLHKGKGSMLAALGSP